MLSINKTLYKKKKLELEGLVSTSVTSEDKVYTLTPNMEYTISDSFLYLISKPSC